MIDTFGRCVAAELIKLIGLPVVLATMITTVATAAVFGSALATQESLDPIRVLQLSVPYLQIGPIALGVITVASEYAGRPISTTLTAMPRRSLALSGKLAAYLLAATITCTAAVAATLAAAMITMLTRDKPHPGDHLWPDLIGWRSVGATVYLVLIGALALAVAVIARSLVAPLVIMLSTVLIASQVLRGQTEHARWLPDRAGSLLYLGDTDPVFTIGSATLVLVAWIIAMGSVAAARFVIADA